MSENFPANSFSVDDFIVNARQIHEANQINGDNMNQLFAEFAVKTQVYHDRWMASEAKVDALKSVVAKQWNQINLLYKQIEDLSKKLQHSETTAQSTAIKYNRMFAKLKSILLDTASEINDDEGNA